jgi:hypothetical protein
MTGHYSTKNDNFVTVSHSYVHFPISLGVFIVVCSQCRDDKTCFMCFLTGVCTVSCFSIKISVDIEWDALHASVISAIYCSGWNACCNGTLHHVAPCYRLVPVLLKWIKTGTTVPYFMWVQSTFYTAFERPHRNSLPFDKTLSQTEFVVGIFSHGTFLASVQSN